MGRALVRPSKSGVSSASVGMEMSMARKPPIPAIPPVPSRRSGRSAAGSRPVPAQTAPSKQSQHPELPVLLEAFWGDEASARGAIPCTRGRRGAPPDSD
jgi:hypothetical protein